MRRLFLIPGAVLLLLAGCAPVGPDYKRPDLETPSQFKEGGPWRYARPADHQPRGAWWTVFGDATLNRLESQAAADNPDLRAAMLRVEQARVVARGASAELFPNLSARPMAERRQDSGNLRRSNVDQVDFGGLRNTFSLPLNASYEIDFWGRVRRTIEATNADADAAAALGETARLTLQADLAQNYFSLRGVQSEIDLLRETVGLRRKALKVEHDRFTEGAVSELDPARGESELADSESDLAALERRREELINAIAVLAGRPASSFDMKVAPLTGEPPGVPAGIPADLLQRRPDIAEAERKMAAANARIGVAKAAFFPSINLTGRAAYESSHTSDLFTKGSRAWAIGPSVNIPIFEQLVNRTAYATRKLEYEEAIASWQSTALRAFQEVETSLSGLRLLAVQAAALQRSVTAAERASALANNRYLAGASSHLEAVDADRTRLQALRLVRQIATQRYLVTVQLIKALGGGWR